MLLATRLKELLLLLILAETTLEFEFEEILQFVPPEILTLKLWPISIVGAVWLKVRPVEVTVPALALTIPQELISVVQTVIEAVPLLLFAVKVKVEPLILVETILGLELFKTE